MSDSSDSSGQQLDRKNYPYFTDDEFSTFNKMGIEFLEKAHLSCKKLYEKRIANFSLDLDEGRQGSGDLNIVVCGETGSGKSSTANVILGNCAFTANTSSNSVTRVSLDKTCTYKKRRITVVDTPGIHDTGHDNATVAKELTRMAFLLKGGVHCFVICMNASDTRFTQEVMKMLQQIKQIGRSHFFDHCMLAYTRAETELEKCTLGEFLKKKKENDHNHLFLENIKDRVVAVNNNSAIPAEALRNRDALIQMADIVVADNVRNKKPVIFTNDLFERARSLHEKIASVVQENNFHLVLVNATIEAIVNIRSERFTFEVYFNEVKTILKKRETSEESNIIPDFFISGTNRVHERYADQVKQIYDEIQPEVNMFMESITKIVLAAAAVTAVGLTVAGVVLRGPGTIIGILFSLLFAK